MSIDNQRTTRLGAVAPTADAPRGRKRKTATVVGLIGAAVLGAGGVALAAILLTTNITGTATVNEVNTANDLDVTATSADGSQLKCNVNISDDNKTLTFNPVLTKPVGGSNSSGAPIAGGDCTVTLTVKNIGNTVIKLDGSSGITQFPAGWTATPIAGNALNPIPAGATATATIKVTATQSAVGGPIQGKLVYTDAPAA